MSQQFASTALKMTARRSSASGFSMSEEPEAWRFGSKQHGLYKQFDSTAGGHLQTIPEDSEFLEVKAFREASRDVTPPWNAPEGLLLQTLHSERKLRDQRRNHVGAYAWQ
mmetsp:Transcript_5736/g.10314  ORF Transcript_5736/g.10314 Transcript_5736/m.10314 type:complete len:110 (-) Transcript_5736:120-449(-)